MYLIIQKLRNFWNLESLIQFFYSYLNVSGSLIKTLDLNFYLAIDISFRRGLNQISGNHFRNELSKQFSIEVRGRNYPKLTKTLF